MAGLTGGLSFHRQLSPAIQYTETFPRPHQYFPLAAPLLLCNSVANQLFCPLAGLAFRDTPAVSILSVAELDAGVDVRFYILPSLFEGCFFDIVAQLSGLYGGSRSDRTMRQCPDGRLDFVPQKTVIPEARILNNEQRNGREGGGPAPRGFLSRSREATGDYSRHRTSG